MVNWFVSQKVWSPSRLFPQETWSLEDDLFVKLLSARLICRKILETIRLIIQKHSKTKSFSELYDELYYDFSQLHVHM